MLPQRRLPQNLLVDLTAQNFERKAMNFPYFLQKSAKIHSKYYALINLEFGPYGKYLLWRHTARTSQKLYCIPTQVKLQKASIFLCYYGLKVSRSIRQSVRRRMDRLSANQILAFYPYFVWYTIMCFLTFPKGIKHQFLHSTCFRMV